MYCILTFITIAIAASLSYATHTNRTEAHECGQPDVVCHGLKKGCVASDFHTCEVLATIASHDNDTLWIDLSAFASKENLQLNFTNRWIGVGFSLSGQMPNSAVVHCFNDEHNVVQAKLTFNVPNRHFNTGWKDIDQTPLQVDSAKLENGHLQCIVRLKKHFTLKNPQKDDSVYDLVQDHHLILATGPLKDGSISRHDKAPHISEKAHKF
ncbi:uncharacterized protein LOC129581950 [Paramacrobiotus metropolitanus]|uniref:uncharacterized protein LOC129581950 n=1 Tax=Paramacrobiotus metropolitanus TaxID=2943436 RepID=UPI0024463CFB|nr:uncharacterized protein LOC129581950 [Paramacrobiotus metropolitanus]